MSGNLLSNNPERDGLLAYARYHINYKLIQRMNETSDRNKDGISKSSHGTHHMQKNLIDDFNSDLRVFKLNSN